MYQWLIGLAIISLVILVYYHMNAVKVYRFYRPGCPHCVNSQAEWNRFKRRCKYEFIKPIDVNLDNPKNHKLAKRYQVTSVPTIIRVSDDTYEVYDGERLADAYADWMGLNDE